jgi:putative integral membrane protein (TIGR02587 family)
MRESLAVLLDEEMHPAERVIPVLGERLAESVLVQALELRQHVGREFIAASRSQSKSFYDGLVPSTVRHTRAPDLMRGVAGGVLLGVPLLYTQEVWDLGETLAPLVILGLLAVSFGAILALSYYVGFRAGRTHRPIEDAIVGFGTSIILAAGLLLLLGRIRLGMPAENLVGLAALTSIPIGIGFAIGNALAPKEGGQGAREMTGTAGDLLAAAAGAIVLALNIAPTEEPIRLAQELGWIRLGLLVGASLLLPYLIVFEAEFGGRDSRHAQDGAAQHPSTETALAYLIAFVLSGMLLAAFGRLDAVDGPNLSAVVVLSFPASLGAALGRMLV